MNKMDNIYAKMEEYHKYRGPHGIKEKYNRPNVICDALLL